MATTELNFGPDWLRALTDGANSGNNSNTGNNKGKTQNSSTSTGLMNNNNSSATNNAYKLSKSLGKNYHNINHHHSYHNNNYNNQNDIKYRYTKEEMLQYYQQQQSYIQPPKDLQQHDEVFVDVGQNPLALIDLTADEMDLMSQSLNPDFIMKKTNEQQQQQQQSQSQQHQQQYDNNQHQNYHSSGNNNSANNHTGSTIMSNNQQYGSSYKDRTAKSNDSLRSSSERGAGNGQNKILSSNGFSNERNSNQIANNASSSYSTRDGRSGSTSAGFSSKSSSMNRGRGSANIVFTRLSSMDSSSPDSNSGSRGLFYSGSKKYADLAAGQRNSSNNDDDNNNYDKIKMNNGKNPIDSDSTSSGSRSLYSGSKKYLDSTAASSSMARDEVDINSGVGKNSNSLFMPSWRSSTSTGLSTTASNNKNDSNTNAANATNSEIGKESSPWKTNSWRTNDVSGSRSSVRQKDFFGDPIIDDHHDGSINRIGSGFKQSSSSPSATTNKSGKSFQKRSSFTTTSERDHHSNHHHHVSSYSTDGSRVLDAERDLFGGRSSSTSSNVGTNSYGDLFARNSSSSSATAPLKMMNSRNDRYHGDRINNDENNGSSSKQMDNSKFSHYSSSSSKSSGYYGRSYDRFNTRSRGSGSNGGGAAGGGGSGGDNNHYHHANCDENSDFFGDRFGRSTINNNNNHHHHSQLQQQQSNDDDSDSYRRKDSLPEWSLEDTNSIDVTRVGTFDASGAFHEALDDDPLMQPLEPENGSDDDRNDKNKEIDTGNHSDQIDDDDDEDFFGRKTKKDKKLTSEDAVATATPTKPVDKGDNSNTGKTDVRPSTIIKTETKSKPIDYFNDPSFSPNYHSKSEQEQQLSIDKDVKSNENDQDEKMDGSHNNNNNQNESIDMNANNVDGKNSVFDSNRSDSIKNSESLTAVESSSDNNNLKNMSSLNVAANFPFAVSFSGDQSKLMMIDQQKNQQSLASLSPLLDPLSDTIVSSATKTSTSTTSPSASLTTTTTTTPDVPLLSIGSGHNNNDNGSPSQKIRNSLFLNDDDNDSFMNDALKISSLLNDFNFDFDNDQSTLTLNKPNDNIVDSQLFMRLALQQQKEQQQSPNNINLHAAFNNQQDHHSHLPILHQFDNNCNNSSNNDNNNQQPRQTQHHQSIIKWFYCDPQGQTQGPFTNQEMYDWYKGGYFNPDLLVKQASDAKFTKLGELIQALGGRCPFDVIQQQQLASAPMDAGRIASQNANLPYFSASSVSLTSTTTTAAISSTITNTNNQQLQQPHSAPIVAPSSINQFLSSTTATSTSAVGSNNNDVHYVGPNNAPSTNSSNQIPFQFDENLMNSFNLFQNLSKNLDTNQLNDDQQLLSNNHLFEQFMQHPNPPTQRQQQQLAAQTMGIPQQQPQMPPNHHQTTHSSTITDNNQMRLLINHLIQQPPNQPQHFATTKEEFLSLNTQQQREQYLVNRFQQYHQQQQQQQRQTSSSSIGFHHHHQPNDDDDQLSTASSSAGGGIIGTARLQTAKKLSLDETSSASINNNNDQIRQHPIQIQQQSQLLQRTQSYEPVNFVTQQQQPPSQPQSSSSSNNQQSNISNHPSAFGSETMIKHGQLPQPLPIDDPLQLLKKYGNENFVPGALSVTDVEKIQRREAEERYHQEQEQKRSQQQQQQQPQIVKSEESQPILMDNYQMTIIDQTSNENVNDLEFIEVQRNKHNRSNQQKQPSNQKSTKVSSNVPIKQPHEQQTQSSVKTPPPPSQTQHANAVIIPQMPQLPKKAVWGSQNVDNFETQQQQQQQSSQPQLSIAEIQRLQEEKEEEERRIRQEQQMQMNAIMAQQQHRSMKWAAQPWQEQQAPVQIKTLAEIQAEEAEKQAAILRRQQEAMEMAMGRRQESNTQPFTPLSVIVAKGSGSQHTPPPGVWNGSPKQATKSSGGSTWFTGSNDDDQQQNNHSSSQQQQINYKAAVATGQKLKIDSASIRQILKTNPKVKDSSSLISVRNEIDNPEELYRVSAELLNKHFDNIDANGFMAIIKDLGSPAEVSEYCQSYLGCSNVSKMFVKFFITRKTHLIKLKQEQERNKQQSNVKKISNWNNNNENNNNNHHNNSSNAQQEHEEKIVNYKSALSSSSSNNNKSSNQSSSVTNNLQSIPNNNNDSGHNNDSSAHIKPATLKTQIVNSLNNKSINKGNDDNNLMTLQVESMEEFDKWCLDVLKQNFELNIDAETFIGFLKDIASPDEINDYVLAYLGVNKISRDFAKNFISKRSYLRNKAKQIEPYEDMCGPAPALTPGNGTNDNNGFVTVSSSNKKKRGKNKQQQQSNV